MITKNSGRREALKLGYVLDSGHDDDQIDQQGAWN